MLLRISNCVSFFLQCNEVGFPSAGLSLYDLRSFRNGVASLPARDTNSLRIWVEVMLHLSHASPLLREKGEQLGKEGQERRFHRGDGEGALWLTGESLSGKDEAA